ncbi:MAG: DUF3108 domain-containing protein [Dokdonella sp.]
MKRFSTALLFVGVCGSAMAAAPIAPFTAEYSATRNGSELGRTTIQLRANEDSTWTLRTSTVGTSALARMAGLDVVEESRLRWRDGRIETLAYSFRQDAAMSKKRRRGEFNWNANEVRMIDGDSDASYALVPGTVDRHALTLALISDLVDGSSAYDYKVAMKSEIEDIRYTDCGDSTLSVPAGEYAVRCLERKREKRTSTSWFAESIGWLPVQIEQIERKGDTITLKMISLRRDG